MAAADDDDVNAQSLARGLARRPPRIVASEMALLRT